MSKIIIERQRAKIKRLEDMVLKMNKAYPLTYDTYLERENEKLYKKIEELTEKLKNEKQSKNTLFFRIHDLELRNYK